MSDRLLAVVILAAGKGKRMKSDLPKVMFPISGKAALHYPLAAAKSLDPQEVILVVGHMSEMVREAFQNQTLQAARKVRFVDQKEQLGTGHAVLVTHQALEDFTGDLLVLYGDGPLLRTETLLNLLEIHRKDANDATLLTCERDDPTGYGRIIRSSEGSFQAIVEEKEADEETRKIREVYTGIAIYTAPLVFEFLTKVQCDNAQQEYYLTDLPEILLAAGRQVGTVFHDDAEEVEGFNSQDQYEAVCRSFQARFSD